jgi:hypothetical protein
LEDRTTKNLRSSSVGDREFEKEVKEFQDLANFMPLRVLIPVVEKQIKEFIRKCNSSDPIEDLSVFKKPVPRKHYQKRIDYFKRWLLENGYRFNEKRGGVLKKGGRY